MRLKLWGGFVFPFCGKSLRKNSWEEFYQVRIFPRQKFFFSYTNPWPLKTFESPDETPALWDKTIGVLKQMYVSKTSYNLTGAISLEKSEWKNMARKLRNLTKWFFAKKTRNRA